MSARPPLRRALHCLLLLPAALQLTLLHIQTSLLDGSKKTRSPT